ncbi:hypothetical protein FACS1894186_6450 [Alphaproteobacteria bacterium]|nr:hypothetical protein FACS1894186_6450 [Alphaproteobacteria bacterium]
MAIVSYTLEEVKKMPSQTDWERVRAMKDEDIDFSDIPDVADMLAEGKVRPVGRPRKPDAKQDTHIRFSPVVLAGLRKMGKGWQTKTEEILRRELTAMGLI